MADLVNMAISPPPGHSILHNIYPCLKSDMVMSFLGLLAGEDEGLLLDVRVGHPNFASSCLLAKSRLGWSGGLQY